MIWVMRRYGDGEGSRCDTSEESRTSKVSETGNAGISRQRGDGGEFPKSRRRCQLKEVTAGSEESRCVGEEYGRIGALSRGRVWI